MPTYELSMILRQMSRPEVILTLKRTAKAIFEKGGFLSKIENLGSRKLPFKISIHDLVHREGNYFLIEFDSPPTAIDDLREEFSRDIDIIRKEIFSVVKAPEVKCTLHEELLPPAYRKEVQEMIEIGKRKQKKPFDYKSGLDYYPFQK